PKSGAGAGAKPADQKENGRAPCGSPAVSSRQSRAAPATDVRVLPAHAPDELGRAGRALRARDAEVVRGGAVVVERARVDGVREVQGLGRVEDLRAEFEPRL